jgi:hypothetical protein
MWVNYYAGCGSFDFWGGDNVNPKLTDVLDKHKLYADTRDDETTFIGPTVFAEDNCNHCECQDTGHGLQKSGHAELPFIWATG